MGESQKKYFSPRLMDYILVVGSRHPNRNNTVAQTPELLRRYPVEDHPDFQLPPDVVFFCQPEGCISVGPKRMSLRESTSFVFTLTEKDSGKMRYGICVNFYRPFVRRSRLESNRRSESVRSSGSSNSEQSAVPNTPSDQDSGTGRSWTKRKQHLRNHSLTSLCIISHHPFFSTFRECLFILRKIIDVCNDRSVGKRVGSSMKATNTRDTVWGVLTGQASDNIPSVVMHDVREIETWILRMLSAPVPVPAKTRVEVTVLPNNLHNPITFALPDHTRFGLIDFPLHLPLELLGVEMCLKVLTCIILENKIILQSRDYNALSMSVLAFVSMLYPMEYMFPVIPLLPTCMASAEQLLLAPTPYIIGVPASFFMYKKGFHMPDDVWLVDLDSNRIRGPSGVDDGIPPLPEPEGTILKNHLKQALASMSMTPQPIKNLETLAQNPELWQRQDSFSNTTGFNPFIYGNDVDSVDIATRVAMVRFFNSPNILGNFSEHTRTLRLYPRPVVAFQISSFMKSRPVRTQFTYRLARTQAVEYFAEWSLCPTNVVFLRVQTGVFDPSLIGDKAKWYSHQLQRIDFKVYDEYSSIGAAMLTAVESPNDDCPTDESGSDSDGAESSSSYSSLSDFVIDMVNSEINGETPEVYDVESYIDQSSVFSPPSEFQVPEVSMVPMDSSSDDNDSDVDSLASSASSPTKCNSDDEKSMSQNGHSDVTAGADSDSVSSPVFSPDHSRVVSQTAGPTLSRSSSDIVFERKMGVSKVRTGSDSSPILDNKTDVPPSPLTRHAKIPEEMSPKQHGRPGDSRHPDSLLSNLGTELNGLAKTASSTVSELFGSKNSPNGMPTKPIVKPFTPLGSRKALVEKSGLVKHSATGSRRSSRDSLRSNDSRGNLHSENQQFLKDTISHILEGHGVGWLKSNKVRRLMEDENYRNFVVSRLNTSLDKKLTDDDEYLEDMCVSRSVYKGMLTMLKAIIHGLEHTYQNHGLGGMASAFMVLEIANTHYWSKEINGSNRSDASSQASSPFGSRESLVSDISPRVESKSIPGDDPMVPTIGSYNAQSPSDNGYHGRVYKKEGSPIMVNGDEFQNIELKNRRDVNTDLNSNTRRYSPDGQQDMPNIKDWENHGKGRNYGQNCDIIVTDADPHKLQYYGGEDVDRKDGDILRELVKNKELINPKQRSVLGQSLDSEVSEGSTLVSDTSESEGKRYKINHHSIRPSVTELDEQGLPTLSRIPRPPSIFSNKSNKSSGNRFRGGKLQSTTLISPQTQRRFLFEELTGKDRSRLWDQMQFWEDAYLDAVAQERDIIGMDQGPAEMMDRYHSLGDTERKRLELDEDRILANILYNMVAFMVMMNCNKMEIRRKVRRLLGKSHIGLTFSSEVNDLLDNINSVTANDIDLKPLGSRMMQKQSFSVHWGPDNSGDMLFMEVCDDCIILRSVMGVICDRWWFEKLVNMTYCPKTKVLCLWRKAGDQTQLNKFYTKKCKELYFCVKEAMEKAAIRNNGKVPGPELGGEFPVQDIRTGQGGLLQVCMEGIGLLLESSKDFEFFVELSRIRKCFTQKGGLFILEEFDAKTRKVIQRKYKSSMADDICYAVLCVFSYKAAGVDEDQKPAGAAVSQEAAGKRHSTG